MAALLLGLLAGCGVGLLVHLVSGTHLSPVRRVVPEQRPQDAVDQLLAGPTRAEVLSGLRTALSPQHLSVLTGIGGGNQLLAVAQVAWTVTQFPRVDDVLFEGVYDTPSTTGSTATSARRSSSPRTSTT